MTTKAPSGGLASKVNGQFYEGGQFMPETGLFCGKAGAKRQQKWQQAVAKGKAKDLGGSKMFQVQRYEGNGCWQILGLAMAETEKEARAAFSVAGCLLAKQI